VGDGVGWSHGTASAHCDAAPFCAGGGRIDRHSQDGRIRTCAIIPEALDPVRTWLDEQRAIWEARLDRLDAFVMNVMKERTE
jgi:hypothetical protein